MFPTLSSIKLREVRLPLVHPFRTSFGIEEIKHAIIVEIKDEDGNTGWAETTVMNVPSYCYETVVTAWEIQTNFLVPRLKKLNKDQFDIHQLAGTWAPIRGHEFAKGGIEAALWSLQASAESRSLGEFYGSLKDKIPTGVSIGIQKDIESLLARIEYFLNQGYQRIKMKIEPGWDTQVVQRVRKEFGDIQLMVDANSAYSLKNIDVMKELDQYNLMMIEQPLAYNDILMHKKLQDELTTPICLDESIHNPRDARLSIEYGCCKIINIKPGRVGGFYNAIQIAKDNGQGAVWCGGMLETGIGRIHNIFLQARSEFVIPGDTSGSNRYYENDIIKPAVIVDSDGYIKTPKGVNLGHEVDIEQLDKYTAREIEIEF